MEVTVPNLLIRLRFSALLRARAEVAMADGNAAESWKDAVRIFQLARWTTDDTPTRQLASGLSEWMSSQR